MHTLKRSTRRTGGPNVPATRHPQAHAPAEPSGNAVLQPDGSPNAELHVHDISGHVVAMHRINAQGLTSLTLQLAPGVYIAALDSGGLPQKQSKFMVIR